MKIKNTCKKKTKHKISITITKHADSIYLGFHTGNYFITLNMHIKEWNKLLSFLKKTFRRKKIVKNTLGYSSYNMRTGKISYFDYTKKLKELDDFREKDHKLWLHWKKTLDMTKREISKTGLNDDIHFWYDNWSIAFSRKNFLIFRNGCLEFKNFVKNKRFKGASINFNK